MGTRGGYGFIVGGNRVEMYNHFDSYPSGLGNDIITYLLAEFKKNGYDETIGLLKQRVRSMVKVNESDIPTEDQIRLLNDYTDLSVSNRSTSDWYCLLRETQGDIEKSLNARYYIDGTGIGGQEYYYIINLDNETLEFTDDKMKAYPLKELSEATVTDMEKQSPYYEEDE